MKNDSMFGAFTSSQSFMTIASMLSIDENSPSNERSTSNESRSCGEWEIPTWEIKIHYDELLGEGSFGKVYLATWRETVVVAKVMHSYVSNDRKSLILREFDTMTKLHHPNVVQLFGYVNEPFIIVMEYFSNGNLLDKIKTMSRSRKKRIAQEVTRSILYLHHRKPFSVIHRDIKPSNVFLTESYRAKIGDFGISKLDTRGPSDDGSVNVKITADVGTVRYMAPEAETDTYSNKVDIYSLGILLYELFEGKRYHPKRDMVWWKTPKILRNMIKFQMLSIKPAERPNITQVYKVIMSL